MLVFMIFLGALSGLLSLLLCKKLISSRTDTPINKFFISGKYAAVLWCAIGAAVFALVELQGIEITRKIEFIIATLICIQIGAVDISVREIPNSLLLALIVTKSIFFAIDFTIEGLTQMLLGFVVANVVFILPSLLKIKIGAGDIKLAAVIGLYLGINGFLQSMIIMAIVISIYGLFLLASKRGGFKTLTAMGPYLALGFICTLFFPIL